MNNVSCLPVANSAGSWLAGDAVWEEPVVGLSGKFCPRPSRYYPDLHGPAD